MKRESYEGLEQQPLFGAASRSVFIPGKRFKINIIPIFLAVFFPWMVFVWCYHLAGFKFHYSKGEDYYYYPIGIFGLATLGAGGMAWYTRKEYSPSWYKILTLQFLVAGLCGVYYGDEIFNNYMESFYDWETLKIYPAVNPGKELGQHLMDAGTVYFTAGTSVDVLQSWHYLSDQAEGEGLHRFCVAPIVNGAPSSGFYDFWAVGLDCCSAAGPDFRCGDYKDGAARTGLRSMAHKLRPFYKLAVEQAQATFGIKAKHPLFFEYISDPLARVEGWKGAAGDQYMIGIAKFFVYNTIFVAVVTFLFAWLGRKTLLPSPF